MAIVLTWKNSNPSSNTIKVYRKDGKAAFDVSALPEALATLAGDAVTYTDDAAQAAKQYTYLIEATDGISRIFTKSPSVMNVKNRGPGPALLLQGDMDCGYFGQVSPLELPGLMESYPVGQGIVGQTNYVPSMYHKFAWKNRILFLGNGMIYSSIPASRSAHLRYLRSGLKYNFTSEELAAQVENIVTAGKHRFHARTIRSTPEDWDGVLPATHPSLVMNPDTEFNQLLAALTQFSPLHPRKLHSIEVARLGGLPANYPTVCADPQTGTGVAALNATTNPIYRIGRMTAGAPSVKQLIGGSVAGYEEPQVQQDYSFYACSAFNDYVSSQIWPVFELIES